MKFNYKLSNTIKNIAILGSTGSIGTQSLDVIRDNANLFKVFLLTANSNADLLIRQAIEFVPEYAIICDETHYQTVKQSLAHFPIKVLAGHSAIVETVTHHDIHIVLTA